MDELSLVIFSISIQAAIGIMVFVAIAKFLNKDGIFNTAVISAAGLTLISTFASLMHLGRPFSAHNALANFGTSWLSREIWFTGTFTGLTLFLVLLLLFKPTAKGVINVLIPIAAVIGLADIYMMSSIYTSSSVPAWQYGSIPVEFYAASISTGAVLFLALSRKVTAKTEKIAVIVAGIVILLQIVAMVHYYIALGINKSLAAQQSLSLLNSMGGAMSIKWLFILLGAGVLFFQARKVSVSASAGQAAVEVAAAADGTSSTGIYLAAALLITGQIIGRYLFYAIMIIV